MNIFLRINTIINRRTNFATPNLSSYFNSWWDLEANETGSVDSLSQKGKFLCCKNDNYDDVYEHDMTLVALSHSNWSGPP